MAEEYVDVVDIEARKKALAVFREKFKEILEQIMRGENPTL